MTARIESIRCKRGVELLQGESFTLFASGARTVGANQAGTAVNLAGERSRFIFLLNITASATDAGDTLDVYVDFSLDGSTYYNAVHFTQQAGTGAAGKEIAVVCPEDPGALAINVTSDAASGVVRPAIFGPYLRGRYTVVEFAGVGAASHTFSLVGYAVR